jgi:hypothetical protein
MNYLLPVYELLSIKAIATPRTFHLANDFKHFFIFNMSKFYRSNLVLEVDMNYASL